MKITGLFLSLCICLSVSAAEATSVSKSGRSPAESNDQLVLGSLQAGKIVRVIDNQLNIVCYAAGRGGTNEGAAIFCMPISQPEKK